MNDDERFQVFDAKASGTRPIMLRVPWDEYVKLERLADMAGIGVGTVCKQLLRQALARGVEIVSVEEPAPDKPEPVPA